MVVQRYLDVQIGKIKKTENKNVMCIVLFLKTMRFDRIARGWISFDILQDLLLN